MVRSSVVRFHKPPAGDHDCVIVAASTVAIDAIAAATVVVALMLGTSCRGEADGARRACEEPGEPNA